MPKIINIVKISLILLLLTACGGGGGGGNSRPIYTDEFRGDYALGASGADAVYQRGNAGAGAVVAIIDTGIDTDHREFRGRIHPNSRNIRPNTAQNSEWNEKYLDHYCESGCGHGTTVASVVAANKDDIELHGIAYDAQLLIVKADELIPAVPDNLDTPKYDGRPAASPAHIPSIPKAIRYAADNGADVINLSAGGPIFLDFDLGLALTRTLENNVRPEAMNPPIEKGQIIKEIARAAQADVAVVFAAGNSFNQPTDYPAALAGARFDDCGGQQDPRAEAFCLDEVQNTLKMIDSDDASEGNDGPFDGLVLGVTSVGRTIDGVFNPRAVSEFSSQCTTLNPQYCLAAPGDKIRVAFPGGGYEGEEIIRNELRHPIGTIPVPTVEGTSLSAPHVAGAIALLLSNAPGLTSKEAVRILLQTADDVGTCIKPDTSGFECYNHDYGNGILNLRAAVNPVVGRDGVMLSAGEPQTALGFSALSLPAAFGDALGQGNTSGDLSKVVAYDNYARAYVINLAPRVNRQGFEVRMDSLLSFDSFEQEAGQTSLSLGRFSMTTQFSTNLNEEDTEQVNLSSLHFSADLGGASIGFATGGSSRPTTLSFYGEALQVLGITQATPSPYAHLVQNGAGFTIDSHFENWALSYNLRQGDSASTSNEALAFDVKAERSFDSGIYLGGLVSVIAEQNSFLAASGRGVFDGSSGTTQSLTLGMGYASGNTRIFGQLSGGQTKISLANDSGAILSDFSAIKTSAALIGMSQQKIFSRQDRFDIVLSRPLKVSSASATLNADSSGTDISGQSGLVASGTSRVSLAPSGQQTNLELTYTNAFSKTTKLSLGLALINQPAHNAAAKNEHALALRWIKHF